MSSGALDPNLASILDSIRATVGGEAPPEATAEPVAAQATPAPRGPSVEEWLAALVEPHVKAWLDANLPEIVTARVNAELERYGRP
jgi:cell pole-organizing protein PopZ